MKMEELAIKGAWVATSPIFGDERGSFREWYKATDITDTTAEAFGVMQANISVSSKGVLRGIHYSLAEQGQSKWVTCVAGSIWDVIVDIRPSSPTFKKWVGVNLDPHLGNSILISAGLGHAFIALEDNTIMSYLLTSPYSPGDEYEIFALDPELGIKWPIQDPVLSKKDAQAKTLDQMRSDGKLPN